MGAATGQGLRDWLALNADSVPLPGSGGTDDRLGILADVAQVDLSRARLVEGHLDAVAILDEAGAPPLPAGVVAGVWAARDRHTPTVAEREGGRWVISGWKPFCSGAGLLDAALVTAEASDGDRLFRVALDGPGVHIDRTSWPAVGMAASASLSVRFDRAPGEPVAAAGFYTGRPGFWWGGIGVAACWWGGALGLVDTVAGLLAAGEPGDAQLAPLGAAAARLKSMRETLRWAAGVVDARTGAADARAAALLARRDVHDGCSAVLAAAAAAGGARALCLDGAQSRRGADLYAYLAQHHPGRDDAALGRLVVAGRGPQR